MQTDKEAREQIVQIVNELFQTGHLTATGGNVSAVSGDGETLWITPSRLYKGALSEHSLVHIQSDGTVIQGTHKPSIEYAMHFRAYRSRKGMTGAVHTHSPIATAFGRMVPGIEHRILDPETGEPVPRASTAKSACVAIA